MQNEPVRYIFAKKAYAVSLAANTVKLHQADLRDIFVDSAFREGFSVFSTGDGSRLSEEWPAFDFTAETQNIPFANMMKIMDTVTKVTRGRLVLTLDRDLASRKPFLSGFQGMDRFNRMNEQAILTSFLP